METKIKLRIHLWLIAFIFCLALSGITAFAVETELSWLLSLWNDNTSVLYQWIYTTYIGIKTTNIAFPYMAYGYEWLAFAHIVIATAFVGPLRDPVRNIWVVKFGCIACVMIFPLAFIAGYVRHIPFFWQMIDCSFGIIGLIPLLICLSKIKELERLYQQRFQTI